MDYTIREIQEQEYPLLDNFLYEAIFIPEGIEPPPKTIITSPELQIYVEHFGELKDDRGLVAEVDGKVVGAVWVRIMNDYGHIDNETPSLAISLSVQKANYAARLYLKIGFEILRENEEEYIMVHFL